MSQATRKPFGLAFVETVPVNAPDIPYDGRRQTAAISDEQLAAVTANDNTLTGTPGNDNDFDD